MRHFPTSEDAIAYAATLLEAIARDSQHAVDFHVSLRCGQAADSLQSVVGASCRDLPFIAGSVSEIQAAISEAMSVLAALPPKALTDEVLDALLDARAAAAALPTASA